jgi:hypothetical protein
MANVSVVSYEDNGDSKKYCYLLVANSGNFKIYVPWLGADAIVDLRDVVRGHTLNERLSVHIGRCSVSGEVVATTRPELQDGRLVLKEYIVVLDMINNVSDSLIVHMTSDNRLSRTMLSTDAHLYRSPGELRAYMQRVASRYSYVMFGIHGGALVYCDPQPDTGSFSAVVPAIFRNAIPVITQVSIRSSSAIAALDRVPVSDRYDIDYVSMARASFL